MLVGFWMGGKGWGLITVEISKGAQIHKSNFQNVSFVKHIHNKYGDENLFIINTSGQRKTTLISILTIP